MSELPLANRRIAEFDARERAKRRAIARRRARRAEREREREQVERFLLDLAQNGPIRFSGIGGR